MKLRIARKVSWSLVHRRSTIRRAIRRKRKWMRRRPVIDCEINCITVTTIDFATGTIEWHIPELATK